MRVNLLQLGWAVAAIHCQYASARSIRNQTFDYVIVGGGPAGLVLANRLTEDTSVTAVLIEAGGYANNVIGNISDVPGLDFNYLITPPPPEIAELEWGFNTTPQYILNGSTTDYIRGKALGGCTLVNYMAYSQSSYGAFQMWADTVDDQSYTYPSFSRYYRKSMNFETGRTDDRYANATPTFDLSTLGKGGPLVVSFPASFSELEYLGGSRP
ncbi:hypothetical protein FJTKL_08335 [Diaporthe vaccinii]|uniref:Glucose-methanol-choline oxidoreductase N-terminal domain-containing protein n=1 Tax=Diaporthe vaccinii TaxID=105482 RepID=A0ABR4ERM8_9PEZI